MAFQCLLLVTLFVFLSDCECATKDIQVEQCPNVRTDLGALRKRRHLVFPDKSNFVMTISMVKTFMTHAPSGWNTILEIEVFFPLPDANFTLAHSRRKLKHRQKRELWTRLRDALDIHNLNGRGCVLQSICEARTRLAPPGRSLVHDLLRAILTAPTHDEEFTNEISEEFNDLSDPDFCNQAYECPFSLLHFVLALNKQY